MRLDATNLVNPYFGDDGPQYALPAHTKIVHLADTSGRCGGVSGTARGLRDIWSLLPEVRQVSVSQNIDVSWGSRSTCVSRTPSLETDVHVTASSGRFSLHCRPHGRSASREASFPATATVSPRLRQCTGNGRSMAFKSRFV